jgi:hypothetical protein
VTDAKGRPTPKRREKVRNRTPVAAPATRKEAYRLSKRQSKERRSSFKQRLSQGDDRVLPPRDRGPVKAFVRDFVDARANAAGLFLPGALLVLVGFALGRLSDVILSIANGVWLALIIMIILDSTSLVTSVKKAVRARFPDEPTKGLGFYAVMRAAQVRRLRLPKPRVKRGEKL